MNDLGRTFEVLYRFVSARFMLRHLDADCQQLLERTVPPIDINAIALFKASFSRLAKQVWHLMSSDLAKDCDLTSAMTVNTAGQ